MKRNKYPMRVITSIEHECISRSFVQCVLQRALSKGAGVLGIP